ncbi:MAG: tRNA (guanosine(46)-N7)-methyltransferase TrmB [Porticoccus sp.]|jgi:tRNA (guanine-N7-)-methyltransferase|nr:tRNA (guanosine(46)-N7)-methyltransferase TrmB [Porticoccus sp.]
MEPLQLENPRPEFKKKSVKSYVLRTSRITDRQKLAFKRYWINFGLSLYDGVFNSISQFGRSAPQVLEIGFGMGESLFEMTQLEPDKDFIGIEVHTPGVGRLINNAGVHALKNLKVYMADAKDVLEDCIIDSSLHRIQVYFPDPWHKKKHNKRRLIQAEFVEFMRSKLEVGGLLHLATDWEPYAEQMLNVMENSAGYENLAGQGNYSKKPDFRPVTKFEFRGKRLGHKVRDLLYTRIS